MCPSVRSAPCKIEISEQCYGASTSNLDRPHSRKTQVGEESLRSERISMCLARSPQGLGQSSGTAEQADPSAFRFTSARPRPARKTTKPKERGGTRSSALCPIPQHPVMPQVVPSYAPPHCKRIVPRHDVQCQVIGTWSVPLTSMRQFLEPTMVVSERTKGISQRPLRRSERGSTATGG